LVSQHKTRALLHFFTDGRDSPPCAARQLWEKLKALFVAKSCVFVASVSGRIYLDRKKTWERTEKIYNALVLGTSDYRVPDIETGIQLAYQRGETDEFIQPTLVRNKDVTAKDNISDNDSIIFYNLRSDRARQFTKPFVQQDFESLNQNSFNRFKILRNLKFVAMTDFGPDLNVLTAFPSRDVPNTLPVALGPFYRQLYMSETEKYAHVTYFFNGGYKNPVAGEGRILVKSKAVDSYDKVPAMSVKEIADVAVETLRNKWYNFICVNFSNADMVGHTGNIEAARKGCEAVDRAVKKIWEVVKGEKGEMIITADHGNAENMYNPESKVVDTMHETDPVPLVIYTKKPIKLKGQDYTDISQAAGKLGDIAPTILDLAGIEKPKEMTGESLIIK
jgi:2,3-bisphosphoglycerate-independent phosphoglycerate mutase